MFLFLASALLLAQPAEQLATIEGKVLDAVTNLPVAGARVIVVRSQPGVGVGADVFNLEPTVGEQDPKAARLAVLTANDGQFRIGLEGPLTFYLFVEASGYFRPFQRLSPSNTFEAKPGVHNPPIAVALTPALGISGRVIDADTEQPIPGLAVGPYQYMNTGPDRMLSFAGASGKTEAGGRFKLERLAPGDYYLEVRPPLGAAIGDPKPVEDFRHAVQRVYSRMWYPGVARSEDALPIRLVQGVGLEGVEIKIAKMRTAALRGRIIGDPQGTGAEEVSLMLASASRQIGGSSFMIVARGKRKLGSEFEIDRVPPGTYYLLANKSGRTEAERMAAVINLQVGEENQDGLDLYLRKGVTVNGRVRIEGREPRPDEPALPRADARVDLSPMVRTRFEGERPVPVEALDGSFVMQGVIPDKYSARLLKPPQGHKVSEVRYNNALCPHGIVSIDGTAHEHKLEFNLAAASGSVIVTVTDGARELPGATVLIVPEPIDSEALHLAIALRYSQTGKDGRVTIKDLLPGTYRIIAYPEGALWGDDPNLQQRLAAGEEVRVAEKQIVMKQIRAQSAP